MSTYVDVDAMLGAVPGDVIELLRAVDQSQGKAALYRVQNPRRLETLRQIARIQSTEASNAIEGIHAPNARVRALVEETTSPQTRPEQEIAGYRDVLDLIHSTRPEAIPLTSSTIRQLHRDLGRYTGRDRAWGAFKTADNVVTEVLPDGTTRVRFTPVEAWRVEDALRRLDDGYAEAVARGAAHPVLLAGAYVLDFLVIHPFADGNGRVSRLLTLLLLYRGGYDVGRFVSLEQLIDETRETYYDALARSTTGWHAREHVPWPWLRYFSGVMLGGAYRRLEERMGVLGGRGSKRETLNRFLASMTSDEFTIADLRRAAPDTSDAMIKAVLKEWRDQGLVRSVAKGRRASYRRLGRPTDA